MGVHSSGWACVWWGWRMRRRGPVYHLVWSLYQGVFVSEADVCGGPASLVSVRHGLSHLAGGAHDRPFPGPFQQDCDLSEGPSLSGPGDPGRRVWPSSSFHVFSGCRITVRFRERNDRHKAGCSNAEETEPGQHVARPARRCGRPSGSGEAVKGAGGRRLRGGGRFSTGQSSAW